MECACGARKRVIATIPTGPVAERILRHVGLSATAEDFVEIRGPPADLWPADEEPGHAANDDGIDDWPQADVE